MAINSKTFRVFGVLVILSSLMALPVKAGEFQLKLPTDMNGYQVKILNGQGEVCGSETPDMRGEVRLTVPEDDGSQILILRDETIRFQEMDRFAILLKIKENAGLVMFAFLLGLGVAWFIFKKRYRWIFEWVEDPEVDD